jgi:hypothetical protein
MKYCSAVFNFEFLADFLEKTTQGSRAEKLLVRNSFKVTICCAERNGENSDGSERMEGSLSRRAIFPGKYTLRSVD